MATKDYAAKTAYRGEVAARYEEHRTVEAVWSQEQAFVQAWIGTLRPHDTVLDIPTGTGRFIDLLLAKDLRVHAWDISEDMLAQIRARIPSQAAEKLDLRV